MAPFGMAYFFKSAMLLGLGPHSITCELIGLLVDIRTVLWGLGSPNFVQPYFWVVQVLIDLEKTHPRVTPMSSRVEDSYTLVLIFILVTPLELFIGSLHLTRSRTKEWLLLRIQVQQLVHQTIRSMKRVQTFLLDL